MLFEKIAENCIYAYDPELETIFGALSLLDGEEDNSECTKIYGEKKIEEWRSKYCFLFETYEAVKSLTDFELVDVILDVFAEDFSLQKFYDVYKSMPEDARIYRMGAWYLRKINKDEISRALNDDASLDELYSKVNECCHSYLGFSSFVRENKRFIKEFFELAKEMNTSSLKKAIKECSDDIDSFKQNMIERLKDKNPLEVSQDIMGKSFHNRGPYEMFYFVPSLMMPGKRFRLFYENGTKNNRQILFWNIRNEKQSKGDIVAVLKAISDETRYQILRLLSNKGPMKGQDIVKELKLAPSTISHHMSELKECGLITEEPVKTSKYYGLSSNKLKEVLQTIKIDFNLQE